MNGYEFLELFILAMMVIILLGGKNNPETRKEVVEGMGTFHTGVPEDEYRERNIES